MAVYETYPEQEGPLVDTVPPQEDTAAPEEDSVPQEESIAFTDDESNEDEDGDDDATTDGEPEKKKKTRRSRRAGYRQKRRSQKKLQQLFLESEARRMAKAEETSAAMRGQVIKEEEADSASTATTEEESSSCESSGGPNSPPRVCARKKTTVEVVDPQPPKAKSPRGVRAGKNKKIRPECTFHSQPRYGYFQTPQEAQQMLVSGMYQAPPPEMFLAGCYGGYPAQPMMVPQPMVPQPSPPPKFRVDKFKKRGILSPAARSKYVALDCEMVGVGRHGAQSALARVTLIDFYGNIMMDEYVRPDLPVTDYRTFVSGITQEMLDTATMNLYTAQKCVKMLLEDKLLIGHDLQNDLQALGITHPWHMIRDTARFEPFMKTRFPGDESLWPRGLKDLSAEKLGREIQVYGRPHCPKEDAQAALDLYQMVWLQWELCVEREVNMAWAEWNQWTASQRNRGVRGPSMRQRAQQSRAWATQKTTSGMNYIVRNNYEQQFQRAGYNPRPVMM